MVRIVALLAVCLMTASNSAHAAPRDDQALIAAAGKGDLAGIARLIAAGASVTARDSRGRTALLAATAISAGPLLLWLYSRTAGLPFGPEAGTPESVGVPDILACSLEVGSLIAALALLRSTRWLAGRSPASSHVHGLTVVALVCMTVIGVGGSGLSWFDAFGISASHSATGMHH